MYNLEKIWPEWKAVRVIGEGSSGRVYEIVRNKMGIEEHSALKVISVPHSQSETNVLLSEGMDENKIHRYYQDTVNAFVQEISLMSKLKGHPNIVTYEDYQVVKHNNDIGWDILIRMELLTPFSEITRTNRFDVANTVDFALQICEALSVCHKNNILHRDIKYDNIFVSRMGTYKLGDFGIARKFEKTSGNFSLKGTYTYMAPEIYKGQAYGVASDIYSFGIVLYRLLNKNREAFVPLPPETISYKDREQALSKRMSGYPFELPIDASKELGDIVLKACAFSVSDRYKSVDELKADLIKYRDLKCRNNASYDETTRQAQGFSYGDGSVYGTDAKQNYTEFSYDATTKADFNVKGGYNADFSDNSPGYNRNADTYENDRLYSIYYRAKNAKYEAKSESEYKQAAKMFESISGYLDSFQLAQECYKNARIARKDEILFKAKMKMKLDCVEEYEDAITLLGSISGYKDADKQKKLCQDRLAELVKKENAQRTVSENKYKNKQEHNSKESNSKVNKSEKKKKSFWKRFLVWFVIIAIIVAVAAYEPICQEIKYNKAVNLLEDGEVDQAYDMFKEFGDYKDSRNNLEQARLIRSQKSLENAQVGRYVKFGAYEQDNNLINGKEEIEWKVLAKDEDKILLLSKYALEYQPYNKYDSSVAWNTCSLNNWLNQSFYGQAFSAKERLMIQSTDIVEYIDENNSVTTIDEVFVLSVQEAEYYFSLDSQRDCKATTYAIRRAKRKEEDGCKWWLRDIQYIDGTGYISCVDNDGDINRAAYEDDGDKAVRPAVWIKLES